MNKPTSMTEIDRRQFGTMVGCAAAVTVLPSVSAAYPAPHLSALIVESQATIAQAVTRMRVAVGAVAEFEALIASDPKGRLTFTEESWRRRDEEREARRALHMAIVGGVCVKAKSHNDCDAQLRMLNDLDEVWPEMSKHESTTGLRDLVERGRKKLSAA